MRPPGQSRLRRLPREIPVLFLLLSPWATHAATDDDLFTPEHVARLKAVSAAKISPDGQNVAYVLSVPRKLFNKKDGPAWTELHVVDLDGHSRPFVSGEVNVRGIAWSPDGDGPPRLLPYTPDMSSELRQSVLLIWGTCRNGGHSDWFNGIRKFGRTRQTPRPRHQLFTWLRRCLGRES